MNTKWYRDMATALRNERFAMVREHAQAGCLECMGKQLKEMMAHMRLVSALVEFTRSMAETVASFTQAVNDVKGLPPTFKEGGIRGERAGLFTKEFVLDGHRKARFDWNTMMFAHQPVYVPPQEAESAKGAPRSWPTPVYYNREEIAKLTKAKTPNEYKAVFAELNPTPNTLIIRGRQTGRSASIHRWMDTRAVIVSDPGDEQPSVYMGHDGPEKLPPVVTKTYHIIEHH